MNSATKNYFAVVNADSKSLYHKAKDNNCRLVSFGVDEDCDYRASNICSDKQGIAFTMNETDTFSLNILGEHNVYNALAAIAVSRYFEIDTKAIRQGLENVEIPGW